jgi:hypothetical protein
MVVQITTLMLLKAISEKLKTRETAKAVRKGYQKAKWY